MLENLSWPQSPIDGGQNQQSVGRFKTKGTISPPKRASGIPMPRVSPNQPVERAMA